MVMQPPFVAEEGELILEKGSIAKKNRLLTDGAVAVEHRRPKGKSQTLAKVEAEEILGEIWTREIDRGGWQRDASSDVI